MPCRAATLSGRRLEDACCALEGSRSDHCHCRGASKALSAARAQQESGARPGQRLHDSAGGGTNLDACVTCWISHGATRGCKQVCAAPGSLSPFSLLLVLLLLLGCLLF